MCIRDSFILGRQPAKQQGAGKSHDLGQQQRQQQCRGSKSQGTSKGLSLIHILGTTLVGFGAQLTGSLNIGVSVIFVLFVIGFLLFEKAVRA